MGQSLDRELAISAVPDRDLVRTVTSAFGGASLPIVTSRRPLETDAGTVFTVINLRPNGGLVAESK